MTGLKDFKYWPKEDSVEHVNPTEDVVLSFKAFGEVSATAFLDGAEYAIENGVIRIPLADLVNVVANKSTLRLIMNGEELPSIIFLPITEREDYSISGSYINADGALTNNSGYSATEFIDVENVTMITMRVRVGDSKARALFAYDEDRKPLRELAGSQTGTETKYFVPDGSYRYIRSCAYTAGAFTAYLSLTFRD